MSDTIDDVRRLMQNRLAEIEVEKGVLERAIAAMGEGSDLPASPPSPGEIQRRGNFGPAETGQPQASQGRRTAKRAPRGRRREQLLAAIEADPGARPSALAKTIGIRPTQVSVLLAKLRGERLIVKDGEGYALSDPR